MKDGTDLPGFDDPLPADEPADTVPTEDGDDADSLDDLFGSTSNASDTEPRTAATPATPRQAICSKAWMLPSKIAAAGRR